MASSTTSNAQNNTHSYILPSDAFQRLRWPIFEDISSIQVMDDPTSPNPNLSPFVGHAIASEAASDMPLTSISFSIDDLDNHHDPDYSSPQNVLVKRADGGILTILDVVEQLRAYFLTHKEAILEVKSEFMHMFGTTIPESGVDGNAYSSVGIGGDDGGVKYLTADTRVFFDGFFGVMEPGDPWLAVLLWVEGEEGCSVEKHFAERNV